jgi:DNA polymerase-1
MTLLLVDAHYYAFRSFYAIRFLNNSKGEPVNAVFGFVKAVRKMMVDLKPDRVALVFDGGIPERRMKLQPDYKANREEAPDEFRRQMPQIEAIGRALGFPVICIDNEEADDVIATLAAAARDEAEVVIGTNDKDIMQMVDDRVKIYSPGTKDAAGFALLGVAEVSEKWGVAPHLIGEVLTLTGDAVDNIPGVPGIGPKTAAALVKQFGDVATLMTRLDEVKSEKTRAALEAARERVISNAGMVKLDCAVPLEVGWKDLVMQPDYPAALEMLRAFEFKTLTREVESESGLTSPAPESAAPTKPVQGELF